MDGLGFGKVGGPYMLRPCRKPADGRSLPDGGLNLKLDVGITSVAGLNVSWPAKAMAVTIYLCLYVC